MTVFPSKKDVRLFVCEKSVSDQKPFCDDKSDSTRLVFKCTKEQCPFKLSFRVIGDGFFQLVEERQHECNSLFPTIKRVWLREKIFDLFQERGRLKAAQLAEILHEKFAITLDQTAVKNALRDVKKALLVDNRAFGLVVSYLDALAKSNEGTTTSLLTKDGVFQRAFLMPGVCARSFDHTTKII